MAKLINLNKAKKSRARAADQAQAVENRVRFGLTKVQKAATGLDAARLQRELDGKKRDE